MTRVSPVSGPALGTMLVKVMSPRASLRAKNEISRQKLSIYIIHTLNKQLETRVSPDDFPSLPKVFHKSTEKFSINFKQNPKTSLFSLIHLNINNFSI
jgi:hypothetical protein